MSFWLVTTLSFLLILIPSPIRPAPAQVAFQLTPLKPRKLQGRFLQITDLHPDPYYANHASQSSSCHRKKPKKEKQRSNYYGTPFSNCDSPLQLTSFILDFLEKNWASELDFVIWTGDNARHDNDHKLPRTPAEIYMLNRAITEEMERVFTSKGIPVVPSIGNNDIWPHNIMEPALIININDALDFDRIWKSFIPFPAYQVFQRGGYYHVEVIPNAVAVVSLNTMYFYDSNKAVGGCQYSEPEDPGNLEFDWLEVQLEMFRERKMQVWLSGHVPPSLGNYFPECYVRYVELSLRFQDTILGHLFGFSFLEAIDLQLVIPQQAVSKKGELFDMLLWEFAELSAKVKNINYDNYSVINVSPSVVPNPYLPSFRIFSYNISGMESGAVVAQKRKHRHERGEHGNKEILCDTEPYKKSWKCKLSAPWHSDPNSPSRSNQLWTPLGYAQYYLPHLELANKTHKPKFKLEYLTYPPSHLHPQAAAADGGVGFHYPVPLRHLPRVLQNATVTKSKYAPYHMKDLTIPSWITLARKLAGSGERKLRKRFRKYMYMGGKGD